MKKYFFPRSFEVNFIVWLSPPLIITIRRLCLKIIIHDMRQRVHIAVYMEEHNKWYLWRRKKSENLLNTLFSSGIRGLHM